MDLSVYELIGYIGSAVVLISFMMTSVVKMRIVNIIGALVCLVYGVLIQAYPTVALNGVLILINLFQLIRVVNQSDEYQMVATDQKDPMFLYFLEHYGDDIRQFFPDFDPSVVADEVYFVCCNAVPAGLLIARRRSEYALEILLDYSIPRYRDYSIGQYQFRQLTNKGYHKAIFHGEYEKHTKYLNKMGFIKEGEDYVKTW